MKPDVDRVLQLLSEPLMFDLAPKLQDGYAQSTAQITAMLLTAATEEWDRGAQRRFDENAAIRALFREALGVVGRPALRSDLEASLKPSDANIRISALERENNELRRVLIQLHAHVEELEGEAARSLEDGIWAELLESTVRRKISIAPF